MREGLAKRRRRSPRAHAATASQWRHATMRPAFCVRIVSRPRRARAGQCMTLEAAEPRREVSGRARAALVRAGLGRIAHVAAHSSLVYFSFACFGLVSKV